MNTISRQELYEKIWSITKTKTAKELNISLAYLTAICVENNIPTPTSRYWQDLSWGKDVRKSPLPDPDVNNVISLITNECVSVRRKTKVADDNYSDILDRELERAKNEKEIRKLQKQAKAGKFVIDFSKPQELWSANNATVVNIFQVPDILKSRREVILGTKAYLRLQKLGYSERIDHPDYHKLMHQAHLDISTGEDLYDRSLRIYDAIINILEALGGKMVYTGPSASVELGGVNISISISERNKRMEIPEAERQRYGGKYRFVGSGAIRVNLKTKVYDAAAEDTAGGKIEDKLDVIVEKCLGLVSLEYDLRERQRLYELERRRREEERRAEEERRRQIEKLKSDEREKVRDLFKVLRRAMLLDVIDLVLDNDKIKDSTGSNVDGECELINKLNTLRDLFDPFRKVPISGYLSEADIDDLAEEFFRRNSNE